MTLETIEGAETFGTTDGDAGGTDVQDALTAKYAGAFTNYGTPRIYDGWNAGKALVITRSGPGNYLHFPCTADDEVVFGCAYRPVQIAGSASSFREKFLSFYDDTSALHHVSVYVDRSSSLMFFRGPNWTAANLLGTCHGILHMNRWSYLEFRVLIHDTTGQIEVKLNGNQILNLTNLDTRNGGAAAQVTGVRYHAAWGTTSRDRSYLLDDVYLISTAAGTHTTFLGSGKVEAIFPDGEGTNIDFTPSAGTDNSANVDDNPIDDTDYNESSTVGHYDLLTADNLSIITGTVYGLQLNVDAKISDATTYDMFPTLYSGTTQDDGSTETISEQTDWETHWDVWEQDPDAASAWTTTTVNGVEIGYEVA
jgi:hypothetical protein